MMRSYSRLAAVWGVGLSVCLAFPAAAQDELRNQGGISSPLLSRCAGKLGGELRAGDEAFPGFTLLGVPWLTIERTDQTVGGAHVVAVVSGIGAQNRRRGEIVTFRFRCLIDDQGAAVSFDETNLQPLGATPIGATPLAPAMVVRGTAAYPKTQLAPGTELRVQLVDQTGGAAELVTEAVVRSSWVNPIQFGLRLPAETRLQDRKLAIEARLSLGATTLFRLKQPRLLLPDRLQQSIDLTLDPVAASAVH